MELDEPWPFPVASRAALRVQRASLEPVALEEPVRKRVVRVVVVLDPKPAPSPVQNLRIKRCASEVPAPEPVAERRAAILQVLDEEPAPDPVASLGAV